MASGSKDEEGNTEGGSWRLIGPASELSRKRCRLMHSSLGYDFWCVPLLRKGEFFAMDARCSHSGGPLCEGDIEEAEGVLQVFCPWNDYDFDLRTGNQDITTGSILQQQVYEVKLEDGNVYVKHPSHLSLQPFPAEEKS
ncbi:LOW QUALITY PROTEIN: Rieske domain-containing protein [Acanthochromis polyacanthus]|uniref:LOW QUALITY PROTEIN: Rieske domain-containing protein n=1 Tax=Acanthochromis polyacanthus TaxID=80966 RepID=UPI0022347E36|nr:LOW QUALITY PROTEIN: Rieske domain-containing protein [Acanthochromis polyacanthus]